ESVPTSVATSAVRSPTTWLTRKNERTNISLAKNARYQWRVSPLGGKSNVGVEPNDTVTTTTSGASSSVYTTTTNGHRNRGGRLVIAPSSGALGGPWPTAPARRAPASTPTGRSSSSPHPASRRPSAPPRRSAGRPSGPDGRPSGRA